MKRFFFLIFLLFIFTKFYSQNVENQQYEIFSWDPVEKAKSYSVEIEKYDSNANVWNEYKTLTTKECKLEVLFESGVYRVSVAPCNILGKKGTPSEWISFRILEETVPYLFSNSFKINNYFNTPVLFINRRNYNSSDDKYFENCIQNVKEFGNNSFCIKGKNIFSPNSQFSLIPVDSGDNTNVEFISYKQNRPVVKLSLLQRDTKKQEVVVSYDSNKLFSGYYALEVRNGTLENSVARLNILVIADEDLSLLEPGKEFEVDKRFLCNSLQLSDSNNKNGDFYFTVNTKGLSYLADINIVSDDGIYYYPFSTQNYRQNIKPQINKVTETDGLFNVEFKIPYNQLRNGYYSLQVNDYGCDSKKIKFLVKKDFSNDYTSQIDEIKSKVKTKNTELELILKNIDLSSDCRFSIVSEYKTDLQTNICEEINFINKKNKYHLYIPLEDIGPGTYALLIDDKDGQSVLFFTINKHLKVKKSILTKEQIAQVFMRPEVLNIEDIEDPAVQGYVELKEKSVYLNYEYPSLLSYINFSVNKFFRDEDEIEPISIFIGLDLLNTKYFDFALTESVSYYNNSKTLLDSYADMKIMMSSGEIKPYIGLLAGYEFSQNLEVKNNVFAGAQAGFEFSSAIDVCYSVTYHSPDYANFFKDQTAYFDENLSIGFKIPIRQLVFSKEVESYEAKITKNDDLNISDFVTADKQIEEVTISQSSIINGMENNEYIETVQIPFSVKEIGENAFKNCKSLKTVRFLNLYIIENTSLIIRKGAFANDVAIQSITLPAYTTTIESGAFENWTTGQIIYLKWKSTDTTPRDLTGLDECNATIYFSDNIPYKESCNTPLEKSKNWSFEKIEYKNSAIHFENLYYKGITLAETKAKDKDQDYLKYFETSNASQEVIDFLQDGNSLSFKVQGDGHKYKFIITTADGGCFYYKFRTSKKNVIEQEISYKKLRKCSVSRQQKFDKSQITGFFVIPANNYNKFETSLFDFSIGEK